MHDNEKLIRDFYSHAEGKSLDVDKLVAMFADDGYMRDVPSGNDLEDA